MPPLSLVFVPYASVSTLTGQQLMSGFDALKLLSQSGNLAHFLFYLVLNVVSPILWMVLAITHPKQLVFLAGASVAAFGELFNLFSGPNPDVQYFLLTQILGYAASLLVMVGFVTRPSGAMPSAPGAGGG